MSLRTVTRACVAGLALVFTLVPGTAEAATASKRDQAGDGVSGVDFRRLQVSSGAEQATMVLTVADLPASGVVFLSFVDPFDGEYGGGVQVRRAKGVVTARFYDENIEGMTTASCPGARAAWSTKKDRVTATFDWSCSGYGPYDSHYFSAQWGRAYDRSDHFGAVQVDRG